MTQEVTQADLNAAADLIEAYWCGADANMMRLAKETRNGHGQGAFPRAFARHRQAALTAAQSEADDLRAEVERLRATVVAASKLAEIVAWLESDENAIHDLMHELGPEGVARARQALAGQP